MEMNEDTIIRERITHQTPYVKALQSKLPAYVLSGDAATLESLRGDLGALRHYIKKLQLQCVVQDEVAVAEVSGADLEQQGLALRQELTRAMALRGQKMEYDSIVKDFLPLSRQEGSKRLEDLQEEIKELEDEEIKSREEWNERKALWGEMKEVLRRLRGENENENENINEDDLQGEVKEDMEDREDMEMDME